MATQRKPRNLNDLARQANVTAATVSMALRDSPQVSVQVREKIRQLAAEQGFTPRAYNRCPRTERSVRKQAHLGPVALLLSQEGSGNNPLWGIREDPILGPVLPVILERFNRYGIDYACLAPAEAKENPALLNAYNGVLYHNDLKGWTLPEQVPAVQIFGWERMLPRQDRITANDDLVAELATSHLTRSGVKRAVIIWREDMVQIPDHPRIVRFIQRMKEAGVPVTPMPFSREDSGVTSRFQKFLESGDDRVGFFAFNALCGVKLYSTLDGLGLWEKYSREQVVICDKSLMLSNFYPHPTVIDLDLPAMAAKAVELLVWRLANPDLPGSLLLQAPRLIKPGC